MTHGLAVGVHRLADGDHTWLHWLHGRDLVLLHGLLHGLHLLHWLHAGLHGLHLDHAGLLLLHHHLLASVSLLLLFLVLLLLVVILLVLKLFPAPVDDLKTNERDGNVDDDPDDENVEEEPLGCIVKVTAASVDREDEDGDDDDADNEDAAVDEVGVVENFPVLLALGLADDCDHRDSHDELEEAREVRTAGDAATAHTTNGEDDTPDHRARGQIAPAEASVVFLINANHLKNKL